MTKDNLWLAELVIFFKYFNFYLLQKWKIHCYGNFKDRYLSSGLNFWKKKLTFTDEFLEVINSSVSMFPLKLQLTPTHF